MQRELPSGLRVPSVQTLDIPDYRGRRRVGRALRTRSRLPRVFTLVAVLSVAACSGAAPTTAPASPGPTATPLSATPSEVASASLAPTRAPGIYVTTAGGVVAYFGPASFFPGLTVTLPADWQVDEEGIEEVIISPTASGPVTAPDEYGPVVKFWLDPTLVDRKGNPAVVANTPAAFAGWLAKDPDLVVSGQESVVIGSGIQATVLDLAVSAAAVNAGLPGCPTDVCVDFIKLSRGTGYGMGRGALLRFYLVSVGGATPHLLVIDLDAFGQSQFATITKGAAPVLESLILPSPLP